ncbi:hypothetical protein [Cupriavidus pampae]|uniref:Uncharacterized protein n=1 Tax=Cupriavidus pampae TaxID=659251 RepID=A0ABN7ZJL5_9BURK|nr:hypothetical protein [Cupriavidus pampae]CAG9184456.1 hypothetical protein LMG32289_05622 [Cupriavidus pampae]
MKPSSASPMPGTVALDRDALARERADFEAFYKAKGWPQSYFIPHGGGRIDYGRAATQDRWEGWRDRASLTDTPGNVFVPYPQCVAAGGDCVREARCVADCRDRQRRKFNQGAQP